MTDTVTLIRTGLAQSAQAHDAQAFEDWFDALVEYVAERAIPIVRENTIDDVLFGANRLN